MRFHLPGIPHTVTTPEYSACAFTTKVVKLAKMLTRQGHTVFHYGHEDSVVECTEHVTVTKRYDLDKSYKNHDWRTQGWPRYDANKDWAYKKFFERAIPAIKMNRHAEDFLLLPFGFGHQALARALPDMTQVEPGIGYPTGGFTRYRVFESNSIRSAYEGQKCIEFSGERNWYDTVIPNYFDLDEFDFSVEKDDYILFLGRVNSGKGIHIAEQLALKTGRKLKVAGAGAWTFKPESKNLIERVGVVDPAARRKLLSRAKATICASTFMEPFCGVQIESYLSGTPVISSDWGAFSEYNVHGVTGWRCNTFEKFEWAVKNLDGFDAHAIRAHGEKFSLARIAKLYDAYFESVADIHKSGGKGWYEERPDRLDLNHTTFDI